MRGSDVVIHTNTGIFGKEEEIERFPPIKQRIDLSEHMWVGKLEGKLAAIIMDTCEPKAVGMPSPVRQFGQLYSFVREPVYDDMHRWDRDNVLASVVGLSRLIHPTSVGFYYAARLGYEATESAEVDHIVPADIMGISKQAFLSPRRTRDWLTDAEAAILRELIPALRHDLPRRIHNALWHHEYAARTYYLDHRWTLVCTGLEALVHTDRHFSTAQFGRRVSQLASELGIDIPEPNANEAYDLRSQLAHGVSFLSTETNPGPSHAQLELYDRLEDTLRMTVLRGMRDRAFGDLFRDDAQIRKRWPI